MKIPIYGVSVGITVAVGGLGVGVLAERVAENSSALGVAEISTVTISFEISIAVGVTVVLLVQAEISKMLSVRIKNCRSIDESWS